MSKAQKNDEWRVKTEISGGGNVTGLFLLLFLKKVFNGESNIMGIFPIGNTFNGNAECRFYGSIAKLLRFSKRIWNY